MIEARKWGVRLTRPDHYNPQAQEVMLESIADKHERRTRRFREEAVLSALREAFSEHPDWRGFDARQLAVLLLLRGYLSEPPEDPDVEAAMPFALEDRDGAT